MKDLQSLLNHPSVAGFEKLSLASNKPIGLMRNGEQKPLGAPMSNQQLHTLLKASLDPSLMAGFKWGKELNADIEGPDGPCAVRIILRPEKVIQVAITASAPASAPASVPAPAPAEAEALPLSLEDETVPAAEPSQPAPVPVAAPVAVPVAEPASEDRPEDALDSPEVSAEVDRLTDEEGTALIYAPAGSGQDVAGKVEEMGFSPRLTANTPATMEVLKYHEYPVFILCLGADFRKNPVYRFLSTANMEARRLQYSILVAPGLETGDTMLAFSLSINLVVDASAVASLPETVEKAMTLWKRFVAPLHDYLREAGRL